MPDECNSGGAARLGWTKFRQKSLIAHITNFRIALRDFTLYFGGLI